MAAENTPGWLVAITAGVVLLIVAMLWATLPWQAALMATAATYMGSQFGMIGARWHDEQETRHGR